MKKVIGVGSPIVDLLARVPESFVEEIEGAKGGMELVTPDQMQALLAKLDTEPVRAPGGSAGNTLFALARMGAPSAFLGKVGEDEAGAFYKQAFADLGGDTSHFKQTPAAPTAHCLSLITPDSERTLRTDLGAAILLDPDEVTAADFEGYDLVHIEGYLLFNRDLCVAVLRAANDAGATVSLDLGSFEVVQAAKDVLPRLLADYVDCVFANEDEAAAYCGIDSPDLALEILAANCETAAVKLGADGARIRRAGESQTAKALPVSHVLDTTGAGDLWAAGFLYGYINDWPLADCATLGARLGAEVVQRIGADLEEHTWDRIGADIARRE